MSDRRVALTFDAEHPSRPRCPPGNADAVLDALAHDGAAGTFFIQGRWASAYPATARRIAEEGHLIGNHSNSHAPMPSLTDQGIEEDVRRAEEIIRAATGADPRPWFRCPFGRGHDDHRVRSALERLGYRDVGWDVQASDWLQDRTATDVEEAVVEGIRAREGDTVVVLHTWPEPTAAALPGILRRLREDGCALITVAEVMNG